MEIGDLLLAELEDAQAIYAHHVLHGTGSFEEAPPPLEELARRHQAIVGAGLPWLAARDAGGVLGFGYLAPFRARSAYRFTVEDSVYVRDTARGQGVGKAILATLLDRAAGLGLREVLALVGDSANAGSVGLHRALGFREAGTMTGVGQKLGRWLDVVVMQYSVPRLGPDGA